MALSNTRCAWVNRSSTTFPVYDDLVHSSIHTGGVTAGGNIIGHIYPNEFYTLISEFGFLAKHPTTGNAIASPYVSMSQAYMKQVNQIWYQIFQVVKENCSSDFSHTPMDDTMERLLTARQNR